MANNALKWSTNQPRPHNKLNDTVQIMANWIYLNDGFVEEEKACLHYTDLSFQRGYGVFDFFRLIENRPLFLDDHVDRFFTSAAGLHLPVPFSKEDLKGIVQQLITKNNLPNTGIRLNLTGGYSTDGYSISRPNLIISQHSFNRPSKEQTEIGVKLISYPYQRQLPSIKTIDYITAIWLQPLIKEQGADDVLYHEDGYISECPRSNFFMVSSDDKVITPAENILKGITRKNLLSIIQKEFKLEERPIRLEELKTAKEAFITSTTRLILPVRSLDDHTFPLNSTSQKLLQLFKTEVDSWVGV